MNRIEFLANLDKYKGEDHSTFLEHYGILGQKWGQRRWQNADGTFNTEGKIRYFGSQKAQAEQNAADERIGGYVADHFHKKIINKSDKNTLKKIKKYPDIYNTEGLNDEEILQAIRRVAKVPNGAAYGRAIRQELYNTQLNKTRSKYYESNAKDISEDNLEDQEDKVGSSDKKIAKLTKKANNMFNTMYDNMDPETIKKQQDYMNKFSLNVNVNNSNQDQKVGAAGIYDIAAAIVSVNQAINNYDDVQRLRKSYGELMDTSDKNYTPDERLSVMNNKKKIALMQTALATGDEKTYNRLLKKVKDKDKEAVEKFLKDLNEKNNAQKMPEDTQKKIEDSIEKMGSLSKPKINKKYLNEDGTLNEAGKQKASHGRKASDVSSAIFLALRNFKLFELASLPVAGAVLALSGFGVPAVIATALAGAIIAPGTAVDHALYTKLEKRADAYYEMLK